MGQAEALVPLAELVQEQADALQRLPVAEDLHVVLVEANAATGHAQQSALRAGYAAQGRFERIHGDLADIAVDQRHHPIAVAALEQRAQPDQFAGQMEADHLLVAIGVHRHRLQAAAHGDEQPTHRTPGMDQRGPGLEMPMAAVRVMEAIHRGCGPAQGGGELAYEQRGAVGKLGDGHASEADDEDTRQANCGRCSLSSQRRDRRQSPVCVRRRMRARARGSGSALGDLRKFSVLRRAAGHPS